MVNNKLKLKCLAIDSYKATLMSIEQIDLISWLQQKGLMAKGFFCPKCKKDCYQKFRTNKTLGTITWLCQFSSGKSCSKCGNYNSFFESMKYPYQDVMTFLRSFVRKSSLKSCAWEAGICYSSTAVKWSHNIRKMFVEYVYEDVLEKPMILKGIVEIDESLFGRKCKHNRGNPSSGSRVWIFGMVERQTNRMIIYPVEDRTRATLIPIIKKHVAPGTKIYSDAWGAYNTLNDEGYEHFVVCHKYTFSQEYENKLTKEREKVHTNMAEGCWAHTKAHFRY